MTAVLDEVYDEESTRIASQSLIFFGYHYFPHLCELAPSDFHDEYTDDLSDLILLEDKEGEKVCRAAPRGFAKSTWGSIIFPIWCAVHEYKRYIIGIQSAATNAELMLENIKHELTDNAKLAEDFPQATGIGKVWRANIIVLKNGVRIDAIGAGQQVRGRLHHGNRPDLIVLDDVETDENVQTTEQREKLSRWLNRAVLKAGSPKTDYLLNGTVLHTESLLNTRLNSPGWNSKKYKAILKWPDRTDLWDQWSEKFTDLKVPKEERELIAQQFYQQNKAEMDRGAEVLWPERWPLYALYVEFVTDGPFAFSSERQNDPAESDSLVTRDEIQWYSAKELNVHELEFIVGGVDPSLGKSKSSDFSAILHVGIDSYGYMYVLNASIARRKPDDIIKDALELAKRRIDPWPFPLRQDAFLVETIQFQHYFKTNLDRASQEVGAYLPTLEVNPKANKDFRISALQPHIKNGYLKFKDDGSQETLIQQITNFPHGKKDGPDCLSMIVEYITHHRVVGQAITVPANLGYQYGQF